MSMLSMKAVLLWIALHHAAPTADAITTRYWLHNFPHATEVNPTMRPFAHSRYLPLTMQIEPVILDLWRLKYKRHTRLLKFFEIQNSGASTWGAINNLYLIETKRRKP